MKTVVLLATSALLAGIGLIQPATWGLVTWMLLAVFLAGTRQEA